MDLITIDFETYWAQDYTLSKLTTEEYLNDDRFQIIGVGVKRNDEDTVWLSGPLNELKSHLHGHYDWENSAVLAHNTLFDGAILAWHLNIFPKVLLDTLSMARPLHGYEVGGSLAKLAEHYGLGEKGTEVIDAKGKRRGDFTDKELSQYGNYCINDVELTYALFRELASKFPRSELKVIDYTLRMFTQPVLKLDKKKLRRHLKSLKKQKKALIKKCNVEQTRLSSNPQFAALLKEFGVKPPKKISPTTGKKTFAFAKSDKAFMELAEHPDIRVQAIHAARVGIKSTLEETRTKRFLEIAERNDGLLPVPLKYCAAHTTRWGGYDKINMQNLPSRGENAKVLKSCVIAPKGYRVIDADAAQIEARILSWLSEQDDLVRAFAAGKDVYKRMAGTIYNVPVEQVTPEQRFVGKQTILGCIAKGTPVLCKRGWVPIEQVSVNDMLWDGGEWVCHQGLVPKGTKETLNLCGSWLTPDHKILCGTEWKETQLVVHDENTLCRVLDTGLENLPSQAMSGAYGEVLKHLLSRIELNSLPMYKDSVVGIIPHMIWTVKTIMGITLPAIYGLFQKQRTTKTEDRLQNLKRRLPTYDLAYAGPRNRFTIWTDSGPVIAHNCGYGMGGNKFKSQLGSLGVNIDPDEAFRIIKVYRESYPRITNLWKQGTRVLRGMLQGEVHEYGREDVLKVLPEQRGIRLPSGLVMRYNKLHTEDGEKGPQYQYKFYHETKKIYGGKMAENVCQAIARCIIAEQMTRINKRYRVLLTVHDSIIICVHKKQLQEAMSYIAECLRWTPEWAEGLPLDCDIGVGKSYGECEEWIENNETWVPKTQLGRTAV